MTEEPRRTPLLGMAIAVVCCGGFVVGIWSPLADALDRRFPSRFVVGQQASRAEEWRIELASPGDENQSVRAALTAVPASLAELIRGFGGRIVFTHTERLENIRDIDEHDLLRAEGVYFPRERIAYVGTNSESSGQTALHEVGHMLDHALGDLSQQPSFGAIYDLAHGRRALRPYALSSPRECFADIFQRYYFSDRRRSALEASLPEAAAYMAELASRGGRSE